MLDISTNSQKVRLKEIALDTGGGYRRNMEVEFEWEERELWLCSYEWKTMKVKKLKPCKDSNGIEIIVHFIKDSLIWVVEFSCLMIAIALNSK